MKFSAKITLIALIYILIRVSPAFAELPRFEAKPKEEKNPAAEEKKPELSLKQFLLEYDKNLLERKKSKFWYEFYWNPYPQKEEFYVYDWRTREIENEWAKQEIKKDVTEIFLYSAEKFLGRIQWFKELERMYGGLSSVEIETNSGGQTDVRLPSTKRPADNINLAIRTLEKEIDNLEKTDDPAAQKKKLELKENIETLKRNREKSQKFYAKFQINTFGGGGTDDINNYRFNVSPELKLNFWGFNSVISYELPLDIQMKSFAKGNALKINTQKMLFGVNWWANYYTQKDGHFNFVELGGEKSVAGYDFKINQAFDLDGDANKTSLSAETVLYKKYGLGLKGDYDWTNGATGANFFLKFKF